MHQLGSACTSGSLSPSHVLLAIGLDPELAKSSLRISIGKYNTKDEIDYLVENLAKIIEKLEKFKQQSLWQKNKIKKFIKTLVKSKKKWYSINIDLKKTPKRSIF